MILRARRLLCRLLPADFRRACGAAMEETFREALERARLRRGGVIRLCFREAIDLLATAWTLRGETRRHGAAFVTNARSRGSGVGAGWTGLRDDARYAFRSLLRRPLFTAFAAFTVALGVGATTAIFSTVESVLINPLPFENGNRIVGIFRRIGPNAYLPPTPEQRRAWAERTDLFEAIEPWGPSIMTLTGVGEPDKIVISVVRPSFFDLLGREPILGRTFAPEDLVGGGGRVVLVGHDLWQSRLGGSPDAIGATLHLDGEPWTVIGVLPPATPHPGWGLQHVQVWRPLGDARMAGTVQVTASLAPGTDLTTVNDELRRIGDGADGTETWYGEASLVSEQVSRGFESNLRLLMGAVVLLLAIACVNVSNLLLFRADLRRRETAVRTALGGGGARLARQLMLESIALAGLGGLLGIGLAHGAQRLILLFRPGQLDLLDGAGLDGVVLAFALGVTLLTGVVFGLVPALQVMRPGALAALRTGTRTGGDVMGRRARWILVTAEVALSFALLLGSTAVLTTLVQKQSGEVGFDAGRVLALEVHSPSWRYPTSAERSPFYDRLGSRLEGLPGVERVARSSGAPPRAGGTLVGRLEVEGRPPTEDAVVLHGPTVGAGYFETLGQPVIEGRSIDSRDIVSERRVAVIGEGTAAELFPDGGAVGGRLRFESDEAWIQVVGVVGDTPMTGLNPNRVPLQAYTPLAGDREEGAFVIRLAAGADADQVATLVREEVRALDPDVRVDGLATVAAHMATSLENERFLTTLLTLFAALALTLASVGLYGVVSQAVGQRTREIGIRIALGAGRASVSTLVLRGAGAACLIGVGLGIVLAGAVTRGLDAGVFGLEANTPRTYLLAAVVLVSTTLAAAWIPSRRAAAVDPVEAMRVE